MSDPDDALVTLAVSVSDGASVDWGAEEEAHPGWAPFLRQLEVLARVAEVHRALPASSPSTVAIGAPLGTWGPLQMLDRIGEGAFADVYRAFDPTLEREVALKLLRAEGASSSLAGSRFLDEARRLARVRHTNVVTVHGADRHDGRIGLWMDLVRGRSLERILDEDGAFGPPEAAMIGIDLCRALAAIHGCGLVHGDIKASNVVREEGGRIVLMDFGAVTELPSRGPGESGRFGTPAAMAPERLRGGSPGPGDDLYALGVLLYRLLARRYPVEAPDLVGLIAAHERGDVRSLRDERPDVPAELIGVIERAMAYDPTRRFASAGVMERALSQAVGVSSAPVRRGVVRRVSMWAAVAAVAVVVLAWLVSPKPGPRSTVETRDTPPRLSPPAVGSEHARGAGVAAANEHVGAALAKEPVIGTPQVSPSAEARLHRVRDGTDMVLAEGDSIVPGDALYLEIQSASDLHVYVLDEDARGQVFVLFPLQGLDLVNPLPAGSIHRLPGTRQGRPIDWQATTGGGREVMIAIAARGPLAKLEREIAALPRAQGGAHVEPGGARGGGLASVRGIGGLVDSPAPAAAPPRLARLVQEVAAEKPRQVWVWQVGLQGRP